MYAPVKQLVTAFSPDNEYGFKRVVLVQTDGRAEYQNSRSHAPQCLEPLHCWPFEIDARR